MPAAQPALKALTYLSLGLPSGRSLFLRPGDYIPPSFARVNEHITRELLADKTVTLVVDPDPAAVAEAEAAAAPSEPLR